MSLTLRHTKTHKTIYAPSLCYAAKILKVRDGGIVKDALQNKKVLNDYELLTPDDILNETTVQEKVHTTSSSIAELEEIPPTQYGRSPCTYLFSFRHQDKTYIKYGMSRHIHTRMKEHRRFFHDITDLHVFPCVSIEHAETSEKTFQTYVKKYRTTVAVEYGALDGANRTTKNKTEILYDMSIEYAAIFMKAVCDMKRGRKKARVEAYGAFV